MRVSIPFWLAIPAILLLPPGCRTAAPLIGAEEVPARATVAGKLTGPRGSGPIDGRLVSAVEVTPGARYSTKTHLSGGFSLLLPPGRYRLEVALVPAERVVQDPGVLELAPGAFVGEANVVLGGAGLVRDP
jgi:hypothetical protein